MTHIERLAGFLRETRRLLVFTGAGVSTGSGIPDYRGPRGVWQTRRPVYFQDFVTSDSARVEYWDFKLETWPVLRDARPTPTHRALADWERAGRLGMLVTQNIDGLHAAAGTSQARLVELHGTDRFIECLSCRARVGPDPVFAAFRESHAPPRCTCGGWLKPATISFGQSLREDDLARAFAAAGEADAVLALGSTLSVTPAALVPLEAAGRGRPYAIVNQGPTEHDDMPLVTLRLDGNLDDIVPEAVRRALA